MLTYWIVFLSISIPALLWMRSYSKKIIPKHSIYYLGLIALILVIFIGFRYRVGGDWDSYIDAMMAFKNKDLLEALSSPDLAYNFLNWFGINYFGDIYLVNFACAIFFVLGLLSFCFVQPYPFLALTVALPYLVFVVAMGYTRQSAAIGMIMLGLVYLQKGYIWRFFGWIALASLFHKTAIVLMPIAFFWPIRMNIFALISALILILFLSILVIEKSLDLLFSGYFDAEYNSDGSLVRILMNFLVANIFLCNQRKFQISNELKIFWSRVSIAAIFLIPALILSPSSTAVDRVALYFTPLQIFVLARMPDLMGGRWRGSLLWAIAIVIYSASIFLAWTSFSNYTSFWVPYDSYLWQ